MALREIHSGQKGVLAKQERVKMLMYGMGPRGGTLLYRGQACERREREIVTWPVFRLIGNILEIVHAGILSATRNTIDLTDGSGGGGGAVRPILKNLGFCEYAPYGHYLNQSE